MNETIGMHPAFDFEPEGELDTTDLKGDWQARAALCELLILSFSYPDRPLTITITLGDYATAAHNIAKDIGIELPAEFVEALEEYEGMPDSELLKDLRQEHSRLFGGEGSEPIVSPYESNWLGDTADAPSADEVNASVAGFYQSCGLMSTPSQSDPLDHFEAEIEFLEFAALAQAGMVDTNPDAAVGADGYGDTYERFIAEHTSLWMPAFADAIIIETNMPFYHAAALLLKAYVS